MRGVAMVLLSSTVAFADAPAPTAVFDDWGAPRVVLTSLRGSAGWRLDFALYEHGRVAYAPDGDHSGQAFMTLTLAPDEEGALLAGLALDHVDRIHPPKRVGSDGVTECIHAWPGGKHAQACIWGGMDDEESWPPALRTPPEMRRIWERLAHFSSPRAPPPPGCRRCSGSLPGRHRLRPAAIKACSCAACSSTSTTARRCRPIRARTEAARATPRLLSNLRRMLTL